MSNVTDDAKKLAALEQKHKLYAKGQEFILLLERLSRFANERLNSDNGFTLTHLDHDKRLKFTEELFETGRDLRELYDTTPGCATLKKELPLLINTAQILLHSLAVASPSPPSMTTDNNLINILLFQPPHPSAK